MTRRENYRHYSQYYKITNVDILHVTNPVQSPVTAQDCSNFATCKYYSKFSLTETQCKDSIVVIVSVTQPIRYVDTYNNDHTGS